MLKIIRKHIHACMHALECFCFCYVRNRIRDDTDRSDAANTLMMRTWKIWLFILVPGTQSYIFLMILTQIL